MYTSVNVHTGMAIQDLDHYLQCAADIVTTYVGSRVMRRHYGSAIPDLIDAPDNAASRLRLISAAATGLLRWDDRATITRIQVAGGDTMGKVHFAIDGTVVIGNTCYTLDGALIGGRSKT